MIEFLFLLMGVCIGFGIRPLYVLLTGRDIPCYKDEPNNSMSDAEHTVKSTEEGGAVSMSPSTSLLAGCCVYRLANGHQCKRSATELTTWGAFCWQHASPVYAIRHVQQARAND